MPFQHFPRRQFLKAAGVTIALPALEALATAPTEQNGAPKRLVCVGNSFGMYPGAFWPKTSGSDFELTPLLEPLRPHRAEFTLFSNLDHGLKGGHFAVHSYLTGVKSADAKAMPDGGISLDQRAAEFVGAATRYPSLTIGSEDGLHGGCQMCWTRTGTRIPPIPGPRELFRQLFVNDDIKQRNRAKDRIRLQDSILDAVLADANDLGKQLPHHDRRKLDEYLHSIRDVEKKLTLEEHWQDVAKPTVDRPEPRNQGLARDLPALYDLIALALQTDSTRVATLEIAGSFIASDLGIQQGYHGLSHHGQVKDKIDLLVEVERYQMEEFANFLGKLKALPSPSGSGSLLDDTIVLFGSGMGNANSHTNSNLPIIVAGGGFQHGEYKRYPKDTAKRVPLCNLYVSLLQQFGVETDRFGNSTGSLNGLQTS